MPRQAAAASNETIESTLRTLRQGLESLPSTELVALLNRVRDDHAERVLSTFDEAWAAIEHAADEHHALTGFALPAPATIEDVFQDSPVTGGPRASRPDAWYAHEVSFVVRLGGEDGATGAFIGDWVTARGGDARYALRTFIPHLVETGYLAGEPEGPWTLANSKSDAWYDHQVLGFINGRDGDNLPTSAEIHDHVIEQGGHGVEVFTAVLPRLQQMGRITERDDGVWDSTTRRPDAWYDHTISSFVDSCDPSNPPSTKDVHDHVIAQGGHGIEAVTDALPRLRENGILNEVEEDRWDSTRRRPDAWYEFQVMSFLHDLLDDGWATSKELHDHVIEQGGHGIEVFTQVLPRLKAAGRIQEIEEGAWIPSNRRPRAWYDNVVMSTIRGSNTDSLPTLKQLHDTVIERGGHGVLVATEVLPDLIATGDVIEVEDGVFDVSNRRCATWYDQTVFSFVEQAEDSVTTMQVYEHVMAQGGHGSEIVNEVFPRLVRAGLVLEIEDGLWQAGPGVPLAIIESQVFQTIKASGAEGTTFNACIDGMDEDLAEESWVGPALERLEASGLIERTSSDDVWRIPGLGARVAVKAKAKPRRRRAAA